MARSFVVDASAMLAILLREPGSDEARDKLAAAAGFRIVVPSHFWLELTNVLVRRYALALNPVVAVLRELDDIGLDTVEIDRPGLLLALDLMVRHGLTAYDAVYLALAEVEDAWLLTLDVRLAAAAGERSAVLGRGRARETPAAYGDVARPRWATHGRYLAELRRAVGSA